MPDETIEEMFERMLPRLKDGYEYVLWAADYHRNKRIQAWAQAFYARMYPNSLMPNWVFWCKQQEYARALERSLPVKEGWAVNPYRVTGCRSGRLKYGA